MTSGQWPMTHETNDGGGKLTVDRWSFLFSIDPTTFGFDTLATDH
jgi:hypothetical protein